MLYNPQAFFTHAVLLDQGCPHCPIFPTAASRRSLGRVSVPVWLIILSDQLRVFALVGHYPTNKLMRSGLLLQRRLINRGRLSFQDPEILETYAVLATLSSGCPPLKGRLPTCYSPVRRFTSTRRYVLARLACVKPAANVRSEPGSNSPLKWFVSPTFPLPARR